MGTRGPIPTDKATLKLRGSWRAKAAPDAGTPGIAPGRPTCPTWLKGEARKEWRYVVPMLETRGILDQIDRAALSAYCEQWGVYVDAVKWMAKNGRVAVVRNDKGEVKATYPVPQFTIAQKALEKASKLAAEFGFTPGARQRVRLPKLPNPEQAEGKARFFGGKTA